MDSRGRNRKLTLPDLGHHQGPVDLMMSKRTRIRTWIGGFGDRCSTVELFPLELLDKDSNLDYQVQSLACYRYTI